MTPFMYYRSPSQSLVHDRGETEELHSDSESPEPAWHPTSAPRKQGGALRHENNVVSR